MPGRRPLPAAPLRDSMASSAVTPPPDSARSSSPSRVGSTRDSAAWSNRFSRDTSVSGHSVDVKSSPLDSVKIPPPSEGDDGQQRSTISPSQARLSQDRPPSPTKGMGGFVQSAMMRRSDSQNKRWSVHTSGGLSRQNSTASLAGGLGGGVPKLEPTPGFVSREGGSRPGSGHSNSTVTPVAGEKVEQTARDGSVRHSLSQRHSRGRSVTSFDEQSGPSTKRWSRSPTKSSWLETALSTRAESPRQSQPPPQEPSWKAEISRIKAEKEKASAEAQKASVGDDATAKSDTTDTQGPATPASPTKFPRDASRGSAPGSVARPPDWGLSPSEEITDRQQPQAPESSEVSATSPRTTIKTPSSPAMETATETVAALNPKSPADKMDKQESSASGSPGATPTKRTPVAKHDAAPSQRPTDFRANLKSRAPPAGGAGKSGEQVAEFQNVFGKLKKTQQEKYVAPDTFTDNIKRGKAGLNETGGVPPRQKKDELRDSLVKQKESIQQKAKESGHARVASSTKPPTATPEALKARRNLGRNDSMSKTQESSEEKKVPEALAKFKHMNKPSSVSKPPPDSSREKEADTGESSIGKSTDEERPESAKSPEVEAKEDEKSVPAKEAEEEKEPEPIKPAQRKLTMESKLLEKKDAKPVEKPYSRKPTIEKSVTDKAPAQDKEKQPEVIKPLAKRPTMSKSISEKEPEEKKPEVATKPVQKSTGKIGDRWNPGALESPTKDIEPPNRLQSRSPVKIPDRFNSPAASPSKTSPTESKEFPSKPQEPSPGKLPDRTASPLKDFSASSKKDVPVKLDEKPLRKPFGAASMDLKGEKESPAIAKKDELEKPLRKPFNAGGFDLKKTEKDSDAAEPKRSSGKLGDRFNPGLAAMLARGPPPTSGGAPGARGSSGPGASASTEPPEAGSTKELTHATKGRAKGPKRRAPKAKSSAPNSTPASGAASPTKEAPASAAPSLMRKDILSSPSPPSEDVKDSKSSSPSLGYRDSLSKPRPVAPKKSEEMMRRVSARLESPKLGSPTEPTVPAKSPDLSKRISAQIEAKRSSSGASEKSETSGPAKEPSTLEKLEGGTPSLSKKSPTPPKPLETKTEPPKEAAESAKSSPTPSLESPTKSQAASRIALLKQNMKDPNSTLPDSPKSVKSIASRASQQLVSPVSSGRQSPIGGPEPQKPAAKDPQIVSPQPRKPLSSSTSIGGTRPLTALAKDLKITSPEKDDELKPPTPAKDEPEKPPTPAKDAKFEGPSSVKNVAAMWGRQQESPAMSSPRAKSPIKLPTRSGDASPVNKELPKPPTGLGIERLGDNKENKLPSKFESIPISSELPPKPPKKNDSVSSINRKPSVDSAIPQQSEAGRMFADFFEEAPVTNGKLDIDTNAILTADPLGQQKIKTLRKDIQEISGDGKLAPVPSQEEHILFDHLMYLCTHSFSLPNGSKSIEVYHWIGSQVPEPAVEDAQLFARKFARDAGGKLLMTRQGKETPYFFQALGGIVITRKGSRIDHSKEYMLCGRQHLGHMAFDEVDLSLSNLCSGFPFLISSRTGLLAGKVFLWKGVGCSAEELGCARLIGMDLGLTPEIEEVDEGKESDAFLEIFPAPDGQPKRIPRSADHWRLKARHEKYKVRLFRIDEKAQQAGSSFQVSSLWPALMRRVSAQSTGTQNGPQSPTQEQNPGTSKPNMTAEVNEIAPFSQADIEAENIYVLDAFFEIYM